ncbi:MAG: ABC transporter substrate-binding protein [Bdellovibrionales bacterium]|nr:ABC transporter substrate-binding protein [Bdellovibrionales bacterium]
MRRNISLIGILLLLFLNACSKSNEPPKETLVVALASEPKTLDPRFATDANGMRISSLIFNSLVKIGPQLEVIGDAAQSWEIKGNTFLFKLHPNISFSNGRKVEKEDILYSFQQFQSKDCPFQSAFNEIKNLEVNVEEDSFIIKVEMNKFSAKFISSDLPVLKILPKKELEAQPDEFTKRPFGTGSYKLVEFNTNSILLEKNLNNPLLQPSSKMIQFKVIRDDFTRYQKMLNGEVDISQSEIPLEKVKNFEKKKDQFNIYKYPGLSFTYLLLNLEDPIIKKFQARRAIAHAINRREIIDFKLEGYALPATSILTPANPFYNSKLEPIPFALQKAKELIHDLNSNNIELTLKTSNTPSAVDVGKVIVNHLANAGVKANLQSYEWGTFYGDITKGNFQMATMRWVGAIDPDIYRVALHSSEVPPGRNRGHYKNKRLDELLENGLAIKDIDKRIKHYQEVQKIVLDELPIIPLWYNQQVAIVNKRVKNYEPAMNGDFSPLLKAHK